MFRTAFGLAATELRRQSRIADSPPGEVAWVDRGELRPELVDALMGLSPDQRAAVFLHHVADMPIREVARLTGSPVATVKVRLHRARRALRASLVLVGDADG